MMDQISRLKNERQNHLHADLSIFQPCVLVSSLSGSCIFSCDLLSQSATCLRLLQGAQEMFRNLPHEYVDVAHLPKVAQHGSESTLWFFCPLADPEEWKFDANCVWMCV